jgi:integrase
VRAKIRRRQTRSGVRWYVSLVGDDDHETAHGGYGTRREATSKAAALMTDASRGQYIEPSRMTVRQYLIDEWLPARQNADLSEGTRDVEIITVTAWILPHIGDLPLQRLAARDLDRLYATLRASGGRGGRPLRGKSVRNAHAVFTKALGDAVRRGHLLANPAATVDPPARDDSVERSAWTLPQLRTFLEAAGDDRLGGVWRLALATGVRRGELLGLAWSDVDDSSIAVARQVLVRPLATGVPRLYVRSTTKSRRPRRVRFDAATATALAAWKARQSKERLAFGPLWKVDGGLGIVAQWIVTEPDGAVVHPDTLLGRWKRLVTAAGVPPIGLHGARHTYAELALRSGARLDVVSRQLGHASISTTADFYLHDNGEAASDAAALMGELMGEFRGNAEVWGDA